jgi:hypothetical protein
MVNGWQKDTCSTCSRAQKLQVPLDAASRDATLLGWPLPRLTIHVVISGERGSGPRAVVVVGRAELLGGDRTAVWLGRGAGEDPVTCWLARPRPGPTRWEGRWCLVWLDPVRVSPRLARTTTARTLDAAIPRLVLPPPRPPCTPGTRCCSPFPPRQPAAPIC